MDESVDESGRAGLAQAEERLSDDELTVLALGCEPDPPLADDAIPWQAATTHLTLLPEWYMPYPIATGRRTIIKVVAVSMVIGLVVICAFGLCVTSGFVQVP